MLVVIATLEKQELKLELEFENSVFLPIQTWKLLFFKIRTGNVFYLKQLFPMYFYLSWRFAPQSGEHHQNSKVFIVCKKENETTKKIIPEVK